MNKQRVMLIGGLNHGTEIQFDVDSRRVIRIAEPFKDQHISMAIKTVPSCATMKIEEYVIVRVSRSHWIGVIEGDR